MKYIKTYEEKISFTTIKKKYIVIKSAREDIPFYILTVKEIEDDTLIYSEYYYIKDDKLETQKVYGGDNSNIISLDNVEDTIKEIIYQTNNIEDAIEILYKVNDINKYNL